MQQSDLEIVMQSYTPEEHIFCCVLVFRSQSDAVSHVAAEREPVRDLLGGLQAGLEVIGSIGFTIDVRSIRSEQKGRGETELV